MSADGAPPGAFAYPESAARALGLAARRASWLRRPTGVVPTLEDVDRAAAASLIAEALASTDDLWLEPRETRQLLTAYGLPLVEERYAATPDAASAAAAELGFPVVVKTAQAGAHKTESGGVHVNLRDSTAVMRAAELIGGPVVVQSYVTEGAELLAGAIQDPMFGPLVAFGPGGVFAELIGSSRLALAPLSDVDAAELVQSGKAGKLVAGWRGAPPADAAALEDVLHRLARLVEQHPEVAELDLNPILAGPERCVAVDARVRLRRLSAARPLKTW